MRDPLNRQKVDICLGDRTYLVFDSLPEYTRQDYDLNVEKSYKKYILDIKRDVRTSFEYSHFISFLKENLDMNKCSFFKNVSGENSRRIKIEVHHDPFTIEDIIRIVAKKRIDCGENTDVPMVAKEVAFLHYNLLVGLIPLSTTVHELVGNGFLFVPTTKVFGAYKEFVKLYDDYILPEQKDVLERIEQLTEVYDETEAMNMLERHMIYVDISGDGYTFPSYEEIINLMRERISELNKPKEDQKEKYLVSPLIKYGTNNKDVIF